MTVNEEEFEVLMVKVIDDVATERERETLMSFLAHHPEKRREFDEHMGISASFENIRMRLTHDDKLDQLAQKPLRKLEENLGIGLFVGGLGFLGGMVFFDVVVDSHAPMWLKVGGAIAFSGSLLLLFSAWRSKRAAAASDPYQEVHR